MKLDLVYLPGDGIGAEVGAAAMAVLDAVCVRFGHERSVREHLIGGAALDEEGVPVSNETVEACRQSRGVLLGAVADPSGTAAIRTRSPVSSGCARSWSSSPIFAPSCPTR